jgi:hypothetical protein
LKRPNDAGRGTDWNYEINICGHFQGVASDSSGRTDEICDKCDNGSLNWSKVSNPGHLGIWCRSSDHFEEKLSDLVSTECSLHYAVNWIADERSISDRVWWRTACTDMGRDVRELGRGVRF